MTQGLITILKNGKVEFKIVVGSDGHKVDILSEYLLKTKPETIDELYDAAVKFHFGAVENLVVMDKNGHFKFLGDEDLSERYFRTFEKPDFNPRWECGLYDRFRILNF